jgi:hypothetical protein
LQDAIRCARNWAKAATGPLPSGRILEVGLYAGTASTSLALTGTTLLNPVGGTGYAPGVIPFVRITLPFAGGTLAYFQVRVWDSAYATYEAAATAWLAYDYIGENNIFTMTPGTCITYPAINNGGGSTWVDVGNETPMYLWGLVPEPTTFALFGLGAAMLLLRRQK